MVCSFKPPAVAQTDIISHYFHTLMIYVSWIVWIMIIRLNNYHCKSAYNVENINGIFNLCQLRLSLEREEYMYVHIYFPRVLFFILIKYSCECSLDPLFK